MNQSDHYFSAQPKVASKPRDVTLAIPDGLWTFTTDRGVFSYGEVDTATRLLLTQAPPPSIEGPILDLGCGYGAISAVWARREPQRQIWAVDVNERALDLARRNTAEFGDRVLVCQPDEVPAHVQFAAVYSNPPIKVGKTILHKILLHWFDRLRSNGAAYLVVSKHLGADSLTSWIAAEKYVVHRRTSQHGIRLLEVKKPQAP